MRKRRRLLGGRRTAFALAMSWPALAAAVDFPVAGSAVIGGNLGGLPAGGLFAGSAYDAATGAIAAGTFAFPVTTSTTTAQGTTIVVTWQLGQVDTSAGQVASDGVAALSTASMKLAVLSATAGGFPLPLGPCEFQPILLDLAGSGSATGLVLSDEQFDIPPAAIGQCGSLRDQINGAFAGGDNRIDLLVSGDFTPPAGDDAVFADGFELP